MIPEGLIYMANEEYLALLKTGVDAWNDWRQRNPEIQPDLSEADLSRVDLIGANLRRVRNCKVISVHILVKRPDCQYN